MRPRQVEHLHSPLHPMYLTILFNLALREPQCQPLGIKGPLQLNHHSHYPLKVYTNPFLPLCLVISRRPDKITTTIVSPRRVLHSLPFQVSRPWALLFLRATPRLFVINLQKLVFRRKDPHRPRPMSQVLILQMLKMRMEENCPPLDC